MSFIKSIAAEGNDLSETIRLAYRGEASEMGLIRKDAFSLTFGDLLCVLLHV